ncbi:hypothetical protein Syun_018106 [Stephania yunnanensis]|uniref:DYW domain-containing protein n=1 Tax=Stephania yunnanensis TaxID=152371 RepID=A0AAP0NVW4_9MAGN
MIRAPVLHQAHLLIPHEEPSPLPSSSSSSHCIECMSREQECFYLLQRCKCMEEFKQVHAQVLRLGLDTADNRRAGGLVAACALSDWGSMSYACSIFEQIDEPDAFAYNSMMRGHVKDCDPEEAILLYNEMQHRGVQPDNYTFPSLLKACSHVPALQEGMQIHGHVFKYGFEDDLFVQNSLINLYGKCGDVKLCCGVFEQMDHTSVASWSALISSHARLGLWGECLRLFESMNCEGWRPDESTLVSVLSSCAHLGALHVGRCIHGFLLRNMKELNVIVQTSLIDMYVKCGAVENGLAIFHQMGRKNLFSYSVMISGLALHGRAEEALRIFSDMLEEGLEPDDVIYVGVLSACSHAGYLDEGHRYFGMMRNEHRIEPTIQHYGCMVDLMGRAGRLDDAHELIRRMPMKPNSIVWRCLLSASKVHQNIEIAETASRELFQRDPHNTSDYVLLSNLYAQCQRWEDAAKTRTEMVTRGLNQVPGFSLVEVKKKVHKFVSQDKTHPESEAIYEMIHQMEWQLRFEGYRPDTSQVLLDVDEEEKKLRLRAHSQKLATALALIHTCQGSTIRIVTNLRMCNDCHTYTRLISMIFERTIVVRDRNRFHHFTNGTCSCRDYW